jgi:hypothetical protein
MFLPIVPHMLLNTPVEPVKCTPARSGCVSAISEIIAGSPGRKLITPAGSPASCSTRMVYQPERIAVVAGFQSTTLPIIAGAPARLPPIAVKLNGDTA